MAGPKALDHNSVKYCNSSVSLIPNSVKLKENIDIKKIILCYEIIKVKLNTATTELLMERKKVLGLQNQISKLMKEIQTLKSNLQVNCWGSKGKCTRKEHSLMAMKSLSSKRHTGRFHFITNLISFLNKDEVIYN